MQITAASLPAIARYRWEYSAGSASNFSSSALRDHALLILKYEVVASDQNLILSPDMGGNSMGHDIVDFGMHLLMDESFFFGCRPTTAFAMGCGKCSFRAGSDPEHLILIASLRDDNIGNDRLCLCGVCRSYQRRSCPPLQRLP